MLISQDVSKKSACSSSEHQLSKGISTTVSTTCILRFYFRISTRNIQVVVVDRYCFLAIVMEVLLSSLASVLSITKVYLYYY